MNPSSQQFTVLAVDDSAIYRKLLEHSLSRERYRVLFAKDECNRDVSPIDLGQFIADRVAVPTRSRGQTCNSGHQTGFRHAITSRPDTGHCWGAKAA